MRARGGTAALIVLVAVGASCGGRSVSRSVDGSGGSEASGGRGGSNASGGRGGASAGGWIETGGSGTAGAGGRVVVDCSKAATIGECGFDFDDPHFYYEAQTGICERFSVGVCPDRRNHFESEVACLVACQGQARMDFTVCSSSSECGLLDRECCHCTPGTRESLIAVNLTLGLDRCALVSCTTCPPFEDPDRAWFGASCAEGHCRLVDAKREPITECETDADCTLRRGMACCESCDPDPANVISVNLAKHFSELVCGGPAACDDCEIPEFPPGIVPVCTDGRCAVGRER
jgi:hypothetical protein